MTVVKILKDMVFGWILGIACLVLLLLLQGCGGGGEDGSIINQPESPGNSQGTVLLEGKVADGYLVNATVFLDLNENRLVDSGEPQTQTGNGGRFSLAVSSGQEALYQVMVKANAGQTSDEDGFVPVALGYTLEAPVGRHGFISPLTTMVSQELEKNPLYSLEDAEILVKTRFGLEDDLSLWNDYIAGAAGGANASKWDRAHQTARVMAMLQGLLLEEFRKNLGGAISPDDFSPATVVVGDLLMEHAQEIASSIGNAAPLAVSSVDDIVTTLRRKIDTRALGKPLLDRYRRLLKERSGYWDATPPSLQAFTPAENSAVPVDATVELVFNEVLDPATLTPSAIVVSKGTQAIAGNIDYQQSLNKVTWTPAENMAAFAEYTVRVSGNIADKRGNPIGVDKTWIFFTIFDQSPPVLPDF